MMSPPAPGLQLAYDPPLGQVAEYQLSMSVAGTQTSLDERVVVKWRGEATTREEVIARARDGAIWLRAWSTIESARDATGVLSGAFPLDLPTVQYRLSSRGEVLDVSTATGELSPDARGRALLALVSQMAPPVLPYYPICVGDTWSYENEEGVQTSRLVSLEDGIACLHFKSTSHPHLRDGVAELGLTTDLTGEATQESQLYLQVSTGQVVRHVGDVRLRTASKTTLELPEGLHVFDIQADFDISLDVRLTRLNGEPVIASGVIQ
ncbi:MAG: hypothetical protein JXA57_14895 [Armatimonadetes bacterium]|nr:hypothetical protein [Armatimonadota bacterium]